VNPNEDSVLVALSRDGQLSAFDALFTKYRFRLLKHIGRMLPSRADAEDVVQEAFLNAFRAIADFREESCFFSWLYKIALNCAFSSMGKEERRVPACSLSLREEDEWNVVDTARARSENPAEALQIKQIIQNIDAQLNVMPIIFAETFVSREVDGFTYAQISRKMHCSVGTVRSRLFRARRIINAALEEI
jgi:RNA polymerase sigma-70 factor (ECF subfamily)